MGGEGFLKDTLPQQGDGQEASLQPHTLFLPSLNLPLWVRGPGEGRRFLLGARDPFLSLICLQDVGNFFRTLRFQVWQH